MRKTLKNILESFIFKYLKKNLRTFSRIKLKKNEFLFHSYVNHFY